MQRNMRILSALRIAAPILLLAGCSSEARLGSSDPEVGASEDSDNSPSQSAESQGGEGSSSSASDIPEAVLGLVGDGSEGSASLELVYQAPTNVFCMDQSSVECVGLAADLGFNPVREGELWVVYRQPYNGQGCSETVRAGCALLPSRVAILDDATVANPNAQVMEDGNAWHFMRVASAIAFGEDDTFTTVGEHRTGNFTDGATDFMGPTWWSSDPDVFAVDFNRNGSHLDMLHGTPYGMGVAHQEGTVYWAYNGNRGSLDRYVWNTPHVPGGDDHSDGELSRYLDGELGLRVVNTPSHLEFAEDNVTLYVVDTANQRVLAVDTSTGQDEGRILTPDPQLQDPRLMGGASFTELVSPGNLEVPSGIAVFGEYVIVSDTLTSLIHVFDAEGEEVTALDTGLPSGSLAGIEVGPDGKLYGVNWNEASVFRIEVDR